MSLACYWKYDGDFPHGPVCGVCVLSRVWCFVTPWAVARQPPLSIGFFPRQGYRSGLPFPPPGDPPDSGIKPTSPTLQADSLPLSHLGYQPQKHTKLVNKRIITGSNKRSEGKGRLPFQGKQQWCVFMPQRRQFMRKLTLSGIRRKRNLGVGGGGGARGVGEGRQVWGIREGWFRPGRMNHESRVWDTDRQMDPWWSWREFSEAGVSGQSRAR